MIKKIWGYAPIILVAIASFFVVNFLEDYITIEKGRVNFLWGTKSTSKALYFADYDATHDHDRLNKRIKEVGPEKARDELIATYTGAVDFRIQHTVAHVLGDLLYAHFGIEGIKYCDSAFNYGCYHAFFGRALTEDKTLISHINDICSRTGTARSNCFHGAGHGIVAYVGYGQDNLRSALDTCVASSSEYSNACEGGVFMEYNFQLMRHGPNIFRGSIRQLESDVYAPCSSLPNQFLSACYYAQPDWWKSVFQSDYKKVGQLCASIPQSEQTQCFRGIGKIIVWVSPRDIEHAIVRCSLMPDQAAMLTCRSEAAATIYQRIKDQEIAISMCSELTDADTRTCLKKVNSLIANNHF